MGNKFQLKKKTVDNLNITEEDINEDLFSRADNDLGASLEEQAKYTNWEEEYTDDDEKRMDIIGQNGNDGEHYDNLENDINKDGVVDNKDIEVAKQKISELKHSITKNYSNQEKWALKEIQRLENFISDNDENYTKIY